jgi:hypothetical protein
LTGLTRLSTPSLPRSKDVDAGRNELRSRCYGRGATTYSAQFPYTMRQLPCLISIL